MAGKAATDVAGQSSYQTVRLGAGRHNGPGREVCVMELASMIAGERFSDRPVSVCPVIAAILRAYNDNLDGGRRADLYRYAAEATGTRGSFHLQLRRASVTIGWARPRYESRSWWGRAFGRPAVAPEADWGPDQIARYLIGSLGRVRRVGGWSDQTHTAVLELVDELVSIGADTAAELPLANDQTQSDGRSASSSNRSRRRSSTAVAV